MGSIFIKLNFQENFNAEFNPETGVSTVTFNNKLGKFTGSAHLNPADTASQFIGCHIAEARANIAYYKTALRYAKERVKVLCAACKVEPSTILQGMLKNAEKNVETLKNRVKSETAYLENYISSLDKERAAREVILGSFFAGQN